MADENNIEQLNERLETLIATMEKFIGITAATNKELSNSLRSQQSQRQIIDSLRRTYRSLDDDIKKGRKAFKDLGPTIQDLDDRLLDLGAGLAKENLTKKRNLLAAEFLTAEYKKAGLGFAKITSDILISGVIKAGKGIVDGLQGTGSGVQLAAGMMTNIVDVGSSTIQAGSKIASELGMLGSVFAKTGRGKLIGLGISLLGEGIGYLTEKSSDLAKFGIQVLAKEVDKTITSFHTISSTGAAFADGMTGMRTAANNAGLTLETFATVIKSNQLAFYQTGLGMGEAARRIGGISKELRYGAAKDLGAQLQNLGYGFDEQTAIVAQYTANLNASGALRGKSDIELAQLSAAYAKDLRILQAVTGEDAQRVADEARITGMQSDILARLNPEEGERFQAALRALPKEAQTGFLEFVSSGGTAIVDGATNMMMNQSPRFEALIKDAYRGVYDTSKDATQIQTETLKARALVGEELRERLRAEGDQIGMANRLLGGMGGVGQGFVDLRNGLILATQTNEENTEKTIATVDAAAKTQDAFTKLVTQSEATANALKVAFEEKLTGPDGAITKFAKVSNEMLEGLEKSMRKLGFDVKETGNAAESSIDIGKMLLGVAEVIGGVAFTSATGGLGGALGGAAVAGTGVNTIIEGYQGKALGGISTGPISGYSETLHGTEAVVPLPDNRSIPVSLDSSSITAAVHQQTGVLSEILRAMQNNNSISSQIAMNTV
jgi:hypothetical protein